MFRVVSVSTWFFMKRYLCIFIVKHLLYRVQSPILEAHIILSLLVSISGDFRSENSQWTMINEIVFFFKFH